MGRTRCHASLPKGHDLIDSISYRNIQNIWEVAGKKRVLKPGLNAQQKVLLLLYYEIESTILTEDLFDWVEYSNLSMFRNKVLSILHKKKLIEYDRDTEVVYLSPTGAKLVEEELL